MSHSSSPHPPQRWDSVDEAEWESFPASDPPAVGAVFELEPPPETQTETQTKSKQHGRDVSVLDDDEQRALHEALEDEYRAWATYDQVIQDFGAVRPFINILEAEARHIEALLTLFRRYELDVPENPWLGNVPRFANAREACEAGIEAELANASLYDRLMRSTTRRDILTVFENLQRASQERHLPAFRRCATRGRGRGRGARRG